MAMKLTWFQVNEQDAAEYGKLCPPNEYRVLKPDQLPGPLPIDLTNKFDSVLMISSGLSGGNVCYMINGHRVDKNDNAIDQMPFGFIDISGKEPSSGCLIHHGDWPERTSNPPTDFWVHMQASGLGNCYPISQLPPQPSGTIAELKIESQYGAFNELVGNLSRNVSGLGIVTSEDRPGSSYDR